MSFLPHGALCVDQTLHICRKPTYVLILHIDSWDYDRESERFTESATTRSYRLPSLRAATLSAPAAASRTGATQLCFSVRLLQAAEKGPWPHVWTWSWRMKKRWHVAVEVWMATGGRGHRTKRQIPVAGLWDEGRERGCYGVARSSSHRPFIYFDPRSTGGPGRAHAKLPRRAALPCPLPHLSARPSVSS